MKVVGLITEYNPFHNGHKYHIEEAKRITGADYCIAVMSGNFVQRGTPAVIDKYSRAEMAIRNGVDIVFELPVCYATASAEYFAHGAVSLLDKLGIVDAICFGSECGDIEPLIKAAEFLLAPPAAFDLSLQAFLKDGLTYPAARLKALEHSISMIGNDNYNELSKILTEPNNILGIEYIKALRNLSSSMTPVTIQRKSAHYHDIDIFSQNRNPVDSACNKTAASNFNKSNSFSASIEDDDTEGDFVISSATAIRNAIYNNSSNLDSANSLSDAKPSVPSDVYQYLTAHYLKTYPITENDFSQIIKYKLLSEDRTSLTNYVDITADLSDRMKNKLNFNCSITQLAQDLKTKNMTLTRINRALIHLLLDIHTNTFQEYNENGYVNYARVLAIKKESSPLLRKITKVERIPVITKVTKAESQLDPLA
ncbi:MAG: nucleotidyltransferase family protein, partial [Mobilitalea sp.]